MRTRHALLVLSALAWLVTSVGCATQRVGYGSTPVIQAEGEIPEDLLLQVGIALFDPGIPEEEIDEEDDSMIFPEVRKAEARFIPYQLKTTLQRTGQWGAVRLTPVSVRAVDVAVMGEILDSNGEDLEVAITVMDATGRTWFDQKYHGTVESISYVVTPGNDADPFQDLYNRVANDMLSTRLGLTEDEILEIRRVSSLRFAADIAPTSFSNHLAIDPDGRTVVDRLPAVDDPMFVRVERIRERDDMLIDTLNEYYADFHMGMESPYRRWRAFAYEELVALRKLKRDANIRLVAGAVAIIGGIALATIGAPVPIELLSVDPRRRRGAVGRGWAGRLLHAAAGRSLRPHGAHPLSLLHGQAEPDRRAARGTRPTADSRPASRRTLGRSDRKRLRAGRGLRELRHSQSRSLSLAGHEPGREGSGPAFDRRSPGDLWCAPRCADRARRSRCRRDRAVASGPVVSPARLHSSPVVATRLRMGSGSARPFFERDDPRLDPPAPWRERARKRRMLKRHGLLELRSLRRSLPATLVVCMLQVACSEKAVETHITAPPVLVKQATAHAVVDQIEATGQLLAQAEATVAAQVEGEITSVAADEGSDVALDQLKAPTSAFRELHL